MLHGSTEILNFPRDSEFQAAHRRLLANRGRLRHRLSFPSLTELSLCYDRGHTQEVAQRHSRLDDILSMIPYRSEPDCDRMRAHTLMEDKDANLLIKKIF